MREANTDFIIYGFIFFYSYVKQFGIFLVKNPFCHVNICMRDMLSLKFMLDLGNSYLAKNKSLGQENIEDKHELYGLSLFLFMLYMLLCLCFCSFCVIFCNSEQINFLPWMASLNLTLI